MVTCSKFSSTVIILTKKMIFFLYFLWETGMPMREGNEYFPKYFI